MMSMTKRGLQSVLVLSVSVALMLVQHYGQDDALPSELVTSSASCGRLCQAREMILRAKRSLDKKAQAELMLLKVRVPDRDTCSGPRFLFNRALAHHSPHVSDSES